MPDKQRFWNVRPTSGGILTTVWHAHSKAYKLLLSGRSIVTQSNQQTAMCVTVPNLGFDGYKISGTTLRKDKIKPFILVLGHGYLPSAINSTVELDRTFCGLNREMKVDVTVGGFGRPARSHHFRYKSVTWSLLQLYLFTPVLADDVNPLLGSEEHANYTVSYSYVHR